MLYLNETKFKLSIFYIKGSVSMREKVIDSANEEQELADYKRSMEWLTECRKEFFKW